MNKIKQEKYFPEYLKLQPSHGTKKDCPCVFREEDIWNWIRMCTEKWESMAYLLNDHYFFGISRRKVKEMWGKKKD